MAQQDSIVITIQRLNTQQNSEGHRTYGSYLVSIAGKPALSGFVCESRGPGDNAHENCGRRIEANPAGYGLSTQYGRYVSQGYADGLGQPRPGLAVGKCGVVGSRTGILIHPAHEPDLFLSSVGCINLTGPLADGQDMDATDSRERVIDLINLLRAHRPEAFLTHGDTEFSNVKVVIVGEPE